MIETEKKMEEITYPFIVFKIKDQLYCINSQYTKGILQMPPHEPVPNAPKCITGMFYYQHEVCHMFDVRLAFGLPTLKQEQEQFAQTIAQRKEDHIHWAGTLERCLDTREPFTLATDPHQCAFGQWFYSQKNVSHSIEFILRKIEEPHRKLHETALKLPKCLHNCKVCQNKPCVRDEIRKAKEEYVPILLNLLDETVEAFQENLDRTLVLMLNGRQRLGLVVDEVLSVEHLQVITEDCGSLTHGKNIYFSRAFRSVKSPAIILEIDLQLLLDAYQEELVAIQ